MPFIDLLDSHYIYQIKSLSTKELLQTNLVYRNSSNSILSNIIKVFVFPCIYILY